MESALHTLTRTLDDLDTVLRACFTSAESIKISDDVSIDDIERKGKTESSGESMEISLKELWELLNLSILSEGTLLILSLKISMLSVSCIRECLKVQNLVVV